MIDPRELSVGNYVYDRGGKILRIDWWESINKVCMYMKVEGSKVHPLTEYVEYCEPIPLTEQWLIDFGFEFNKENDVYDLELKGFVFKHKLQYSLEDMKIWIINGVDDFVNVSECKYVHQLQNLYFALTGKELTK